MTEKLDAASRAEALKALAMSSWAEDAERDAIIKTFRFRNFVGAWSWMTAVAIWAEKMDHHPEWRNVYSTVEVLLTTHDAGGLTQKDLDLARKMDQLARG